MNETNTFWSTNDLTRSHACLTNNNGHTERTLKSKWKKIYKYVKIFIRETTVEPCLFVYMLCIALSSMAVQNMHLEKSCRVNYQFSDDVCNRIRDRNTTGLEDELAQVQSLVAKVIAWKFPLQTGIPALLVLFIGAWSDKTKKRKICILFPMIGEMIANIGLLLATYFFDELSLAATALIEALPPAFTGSYIIIFMGMYSFMSDRTSVEDRTLRLGVVSIFVNLGTPMGTALSGLALRALGYYGVFTLILTLHCLSFAYGLFKLEDIVYCDDDKVKCNSDRTGNVVLRKLSVVFGLVVNTVMVGLKPRLHKGRTQIFLVLILYLLMVGPLYGDSQVAYLYAIWKFSFNEVEYSLYSTITIMLNIIGTTFCITVLSKKFCVQDTIVGILAGVSRIAGCLVLAFAPTRGWYYCAPLFSIFSQTSLVALRSTVTKSVPNEEVAKLSSLLGVVEAIAPSVYMPTSSYIYVNTMKYFPGAFYLFDAALTLVAICLFGWVYVLIKHREAATGVSVVDQKNVQSIAKEVSRF